MKCVNHPNAPAIDSCSGCQVALCGQCANFVGDMVLCDRCAEAQESERYVSSQKEQFDRPASNARIAIDPEPNAAADRRQKKHEQRTMIQVAVIVLCLLVVAAQALFFSRQESPAVASMPPVGALPITNLAECLAVFQEIGAMLAAGEAPGPELRCNDASGANIVRRVGSDTVIEHPQPAFYGLSRLSVSTSQPQPLIED